MFGLFECSSACLICSSARVRSCARVGSSSARVRVCMCSSACLACSSSRVAWTPKLINEACVTSLEFDELVAWCSFGHSLPRSTHCSLHSLVSSKSRRLDLDRCLLFWDRCLFGIVAFLGSLPYDSIWSSDSRLVAPFLERSSYSGSGALWLSLLNSHTN